MLFDTVENLNRYKSIPNLDRILDFLKNRNLSDLTEGKIEIWGKKLFANVASYLPKPAEEKNFETHGVYTDVHLLVKGKEKIQFASRDSSRELLEDKMATEDFQLCRVSGDVSEIVLEENDFAVFFPQEPHKPGCSFQKSETPVLKIVFKTTL